MTNPAHPEIGEAVEGIELVTRSALWRRIEAGSVRDGFTVQEQALHERFLENRTSFDD